MDLYRWEGRGGVEEEFLRESVREGAQGGLAGRIWRVADYGEEGDDGRSED